jgi:hypothetical protein
VSSSGAVVTDQVGGCGGSGRWAGQRAGQWPAPGRCPADRRLFDRRFVRQMVMHCHSATWRTENGKTVWLRLPKTPGRGPGAAQAADACLQYRTADRCSVSRSFLAWRSGVRTPAPRPAASAAGVAFPTDAAARPAVASRLPARPRRRGPGGEAQAVRRGSKPGQPERFGPASTRPLPTLMRKTGCLHRTPAGPATCAMPRTAIRVISDSDNLPDPRRKKPGPMFDPSGQPSISDVTCHGGRLSYHGTR